MDACVVDAVVYMNGTITSDAKSHPLRHFLRHEDEYLHTLQVLVDMTRLYGQRQLKMVGNSVLNEPQGPGVELARRVVKIIMRGK